MPIGYSLKPTGPLDRFYRWLSKVSSKYAGGADQLPPPEAMEGFLKAQRLAYDAVLHVGKLLKVGMTEKEAADLLEGYLRDHGTERYLHRAFAWFGDHSRFDGYLDYADYHPSGRKLEPDHVAILDVSPVVDGYIGDVGYAICLTPNPSLDSAKGFLLQLREDIPKMFASPMTAAEIWAEIDNRIHAAGYDNVHAKYPHCVLGHRVFRVKPKKGKHLRIGTKSFGWFSLETNLAFLKLGLRLKQQPSAPTPAPGR
ncbi:M24 family metallopeptidase [Pseudomonas kuykendallii]|uniref:M24 family metallopeptidase n=1 Tax=Pseudomonas kuykendallii TaxID=1007099 RepID=UPI002899F64D|nr:M24 family metallopeptidase [Pseudomonas kuykendallii]